MNLELYHGDLVAVVGKIGAGKSTFLNCLITEVPTYKGSLKFKGIEGNSNCNDKINFRFSYKNWICRIRTLYIPRYN